MLKRRRMAVAEIGQCLGLVLLLGLIGGCGGKKPDNGMVPVSGVLEVDGQPAVGVVIELHPQSNAPTLAKGITSDGGRFEISTLTQGDGVKPGTYDVTFVWSEFNIVTRSQEGDRLNGHYAKPDKSSVQWIVPEGDAWDAGTVELSSKK
ncbi:peptidase associated/transthyretin-like domain-containing protein [Rhodopirellula bahusiensis]|uniref:Carboxypeptidase regulatory-like domain-containing protein n=1 Tax=Rhodopirellula bahusiensis TaxID=2014065 RepID=A0A2G1WDP1_9BACT|nr:hypothetical protein [Rhodopirellula bahusiensis]PHQ37138.1 hypothetical protein CEE69_01935 [Rhodopirellula bahusiensis]